MFHGLPFRIGKAGAQHRRMIKRAADANCTTGGFYESPTSGQNVNVSQPVTIDWDATCLDITIADIYLYAPSTATPLIQMFKDVDFTKGTFTTNFNGKWWNQTTTVDLQLAIVESGSQPFMATLPAGPIWHAQYTATSSSSDSILNSNATESGVTEVNNLPNATKSGLSKGSIAAAVLVPLIVLGLALGGYIKYVRSKEKKSRKRWSEAVDKRMSVISSDWRSLGPAGAEAAIRASVYGDANRMSFSGANGPRPQSTFVADGSQPQMEQIRQTGVGLRGGNGAGAERTSRISFAPDTRFSRASMASEGAARPRPGGGGRAGVPSRAFHSGYIPPVPTRQSQYVADESQDMQRGDLEDERAMSPRQKDGPATLSADDIQEQVQGLHHGIAEAAGTNPRPSLDSAVIPALSMMRTNNDSQFDDIYQPTPSPSPYAATFATAHRPDMHAELRSPPPAAPKSPVTEALSMQPMEAGMMMSPDDMLKVYAERRRTGASSGTASPMISTPGLAYPLPVATPTTPRTLYSPATPGFEQTEVVRDPFESNHARTRSNGTYYDTEDAYFGTE
ncbi:hypothetical protein SCHPADRAFT_859755 [Schizopora paradoxa]|uniref:Uncharacterized protein n=1 Tax=Schizopora paradoxa TaxID=27342 RepID=A0A0H2R7F3_9AGAM|nr:hypothetical protein SCHPADRAFT_859755 [Schizopora paradoxa]